MTLQRLRSVISNIAELVRGPATEEFDENVYYYAPPPTKNRVPEFKYGHTDEKGPFFKTAPANVRITQKHAQALTEKILLYKPVGFPLTTREELEHGYDAVLSLGHAPLEERIYEIIDHAILVNRSFSCVNALNRELVNHSISGKPLAYVRNLVEEIGSEFYLPKEGDI